MSTQNWNWNKSEPINLARYVNQDAGQFLQLSQNSLDLLRQGNYHLIRAIYESLLKREPKIQYDLQSYNASNANGDTQAIRQASEILETSCKGTCLDLALLFCGVCIANKILPILVFIEGHALVAVSLNYQYERWDSEERKKGENNLFKKCSGLLNLQAPNNCSQFKELVEQQQYILIECTGFAQSKSLNSNKPEGANREQGLLTFDKAVESGKNQLEQQTGRPPLFALDIAQIHHTQDFTPYSITLPGAIIALQEKINGFLNSLLLNIEKELEKLKKNQNDQGFGQYIPIQVSGKRIYPPLIKTPSGYPETDLERTNSSDNNKVKDQEKLTKALEQSNQPSSTKNQLITKDQSSSISDSFYYKLTQGYPVDWEELIVKAAEKDYKLIMVLADPGMGKSTLLRMTAWKKIYEQIKNSTKKIDDTLNFPIFIKLSEIANCLEQQEEIIDLIYNFIEKKFKIEPEVLEILKKQLKKGKCLILLDALDEVSSKQKNVLEERLRKFISNYQGKIIFTSRIVGYNPNFFDVTQRMIEVQLEGFSQNKILQYIKRLFDNDVMVTQLKQLLEQPQFRDLTQNPQLLFFICEMYKNNENKNKEISNLKRGIDIYTTIIENFMNKSGDTVEEKKAKKDLLSEIAFHLTTNSNDQIEYSKLMEFIQEILQDDDKDIKERLNYPNVEELIREISEKNGFLSKIETYYSFPHRIFQEYFTALYLSEQETESREHEVLQHIWEYEWHEIIVLLAGLLKKRDSKQFINRILEEDDDIFLTLKLLAGRCLAERQLDHKDSQESWKPATIIDSIYDLWHHYPSLNFTWKTIVAIGQVNLPNFENLMLKKLQGILEDTNEDQEVKKASVSLLGDIGHPDAIKGLFSALKSPYWRLKRQAALALGKIGSTEVIKELVNYGFKHPDIHFQKYEIRLSLESIDSPEVVQELIKALKNQAESFSFRSMAAWTLIQISNNKIENQDEIIEALMNVFNQIDSSSCAEKDVLAFQKTLIQALSEIKDEKEKVVNELEIIFDKYKNSLQIRVSAMEALGKIGTKKAVETLSQFIDQYQNSPQIKISAIEALGKIGNEKAIKTIIEAYKVENNRFNKPKILKVLSNIDKLDAESILSDLSDIANKNSNNENHDIKNAINLALQKIRDKQISDSEQINSTPIIPNNSQEIQDEIRCLISYIDTEQNYYVDDIRNAAKERLRNINNPDAVPHLIQALRHYKCPEVKIEVVRCLNHSLVSQGSNNEEAINILIDTLKNEDETVVQTAASVLEQLGTETTAKNLINCLKNQDPNSNDPYIFELAKKLATKYNLVVKPDLSVCNTHGLA